MAAELAIEENTKSDNRLLGMTTSTGPSLLSIPPSTSASDVLANIHPIPFVVLPPPQQAVGDWARLLAICRSGSEAMRRVLTQRQGKGREGRGTIGERRTTKGERRRDSTMYVGQGKDEPSRLTVLRDAEVGKAGVVGVGLGEGGCRAPGLGLLVVLHATRLHSGWRWRRVTLLRAIRVLALRVTVCGRVNSASAFRSGSGLAWRGRGRGVEAGAESLLSRTGLVEELVCTLVVCCLMADGHRLVPLLVGARVGNIRKRLYGRIWDRTDLG